MELTGSKRLQERPISDLVNAIAAIRPAGSGIEYLGKEGSLPLKIKGKKRQGNSQIELAGDIRRELKSSSGHGLRFVVLEAMLLYFPFVYDLSRWCYDRAFSHRQKWKVPERA